jgi:hypothetical protein
VHHSTIHKENPTRCNNVSNFIIPYVYEAQHVSGDTLPIIRSLNLHWQPLVFHMWKVVCTCSWWTLLGTVCVWQRPPTTCTNNLPHMKNQKLPVHIYAPDDGRCVARNMLSFIYIWNNKIWCIVASCWVFCMKNIHYILSPLRAYAFPRPLASFQSFSVVYLGLFFMWSSYRWRPPAVPPAIQCFLSSYFIYL